jgi:1-acyl-sn-glycerol-3-phosphate acyltransferase
MTDAIELTPETTLDPLSTTSREVPWLDRFARVVTYPWFRIVHAVRWFGPGNIPRRGPVLMAANHQSFYDPVIVSLTAGRRITYMGLKRFFGYPVLGGLMRRFGCVPVPEHPRTATAYRELLRALREGAACGIFPEGGRSADGLVGSPRPGVGALALAGEAPVVPVTIHGAYRAWPIGRHLPRAGRIEVLFGRPMRFTTKGQDRPIPRERRAEVSKEIMLRIAEGFAVLGREDVAERSRARIAEEAGSRNEGMRE